jgi:hypothetical protein
LSMQVIVRIKAALNIRLSPRVILFNNLSQIASQCDKERPDTAQDSKTGVKEESGDGLFSKLRKKIKIA